jgi:A/G-specific adenine glycosylase
MNRLASKLLAWYHTNKRTPPWRDHPDPYAVWVSEIMLQQTRVETVIPYFEKWMRLFPDVRSLANASEQDVLNAWEGLGYYSRARNLHKAAKIVAEQYNGELPRDLDELRKLPGIGRYTLGAIASMAFGLDVSALDGNIKRVYARLFDVTEPVDTPAGENFLWQLADKNLPKGHAGDYNQALMDLGSMICVPKNPRCLICPVMKLCKARQKGTQNERPILSPM